MAVKRRDLPVLIACISLCSVSVCRSLEAVWREMLVVMPISSVPIEHISS